MKSIRQMNKLSYKRRW